MSHNFFNVIFYGYNVIFCFWNNVPGSVADGFLSAAARFRKYFSARSAKKIIILVLVSGLLVWKVNSK